MSRRLEYLPLRQAEQIANIIGPGSAAAKAIAEMKLRQARGEDVCLFTSGNSILVGSAPKEPGNDRL